MEAAAGLMDGYFLPMAARVLGDASVPEDERDARTLATWIMATVIEKAAVTAVAGDPAAREHVLGGSTCWASCSSGWASRRQRRPKRSSGAPGSAGPSSLLPHESRERYADAVQHRRALAHHALALGPL